MGKTVYYDLCNEEQYTILKLNKKWGLKRIYRYLYEHFPPVGEHILYNHILSCCGVAKSYPTYKQVWGLRRLIVKLSNSAISLKDLPMGRFTMGQTVKPREITTKIER